MAVCFRVLGPVGFDDVVPGFVSPRARAVLAMLVLADGSPVRPDRLISGVWGREVPQHPGSALQVVVSRLRTALDARGVGLDLYDAGYALVTSEFVSDLRRARDAADEARAAFARGDVRLSAARAEFGLGSWSGNSLADVAEFPFAAEAVRRLNALRLDLVGLRNRAYLRLGCFAEILADIDIWIALDPWREPLRTQQMLALHAEGRTVEAVAVYSAFRDALVTEYGLEPSYDCRELHRAILQDDPAIMQAFDSFRRLHAGVANTEVGDNGLADSAIRLVWAARSLVGTEGVSVLGAEGDHRTWLLIESTGAAAVALRLATDRSVIDDTMLVEALRATKPVGSDGGSRSEVGASPESS